MERWFFAAMAKTCASKLLWIEETAGVKESVLDRQKSESQLEAAKMADRRGPRGRFAPSPSGEMHLGNAWTALLAWLDIRSHNGTMVLRMEDLDPDRCRPEYAAQFLADLHWLGLDWDEGPDRGGDCAPYQQSERNQSYQTFFDQLTEAGRVYPCFCSRAELRSVASAPHADDGERVYSGRCAALSGAEVRQRLAAGRRPAYRLKVAEATIAFEDGIMGRQQQNLRQDCGDFVIRRADGIFAYQLAVVADDAAMAMDRVLRGADLLASTPRQIYLWQLLDRPVPQFIHVPLLLGSDGRRLSKRHASLSLAALRRQGISPQSIIGKLAARAGLIAKPETVNASELIGEFQLSKLPRQPVVMPDDVMATSDGGKETKQDG